MGNKGQVIAIDAMGGDKGAEVSVPGALQVLDEIPSLRLKLVGGPDVLAPMLAGQPPNITDRVEVVPASQVVGMDERPRDAMRKKKNSSMRVALDLVKSGDADACVSSGNTGALMATARFVLKTLPGIDRPAIISVIPAIGGHTHMLDLGANAHCTAEQLFQFGVMGSVVATDIHGIARPRLGLLNIGEEDIKGNELIREAARMLSESRLNYIGFVEGDDIFSGEVDVVVTDGFTGNVSLKTMEGVSHMLSATMRSEFTRNALNKTLGLLASPVLSAVRDRLDPRRYNGASLVGLTGIVIKSHGGADVFAFKNAIRTATIEIDKGVPTQISELLRKQPA